MKQGSVFLVGAGPGDKDLITVKGWRLIQKADVILYDRLIPAELLDEARPDAEIIYVGKQPTKHRLSQDEINALMVQKAQAGNSVVRLKGGDPLVFGRGSEEALVCHAENIPFEIVPGISSAVAVPAYAGIPVTHRQVSESFSVLTGHRIHEPEKYQHLVGLGGTIVMLMGVRLLAQHVEHLLAAGLPMETPAAIIEDGTTIHQRVIDGSVQTLIEMAKLVQSPAIVIIGEVVRLRHAGVQWFGKEAGLNELLAGIPNHHPRDWAG